MRSLRQPIQSAKEGKVPLARSATERERERFIKRLQATYEVAGALRAHLRTSPTFAGYSASLATLYMEAHVIPDFLQPSLTLPRSYYIHTHYSQYSTHRRGHRTAIVRPPFDFTTPVIRVSARTMASDGKKFPPQEQAEQPGREHEMNPTPEFVRPNYKPADKLLGKVAVVTGGDSGIGRSVACHFALEGASVAITYVPDVEEKDAEDTLHLLRSQYKNPHVKADHIKIPVDLGFDENCKKVVEQVVDAYKRIDILVNNAAEQYTVTKFEDISTDQVERVFRTNIFSHFYLTKYALNYMKEGSSIINTTSVNAYKGNASLLDYTSTKGAIVAFTRGLALHVVGRGIRVNGVAPGPIWTPLIPSSFPVEKTEKFGEQVPMKRAGQPSEVGPSYVFLASEDSSYYTGQVLHPNGGVVVNA